MHRLICNLEWAVKVHSPGFARQKGAKGAKAQGLHFEALVAKSIKGSRRGLWYEFCDANGPGLASPDILLPTPFGLLVLECKLSDTIRAESQLLNLYKPILEFVYKRPVLCTVVTKHLNARSAPTRVVSTLKDAILMASDLATVPTLHWLGKTPAHLSPL